MDNEHAASTRRGNAALTIGLIFSSVLGLAYVFWEWRQFRAETPPLSRLSASGDGHEVTAPSTGLIVTAFTIPAKSPRLSAAPSSESERVRIVLRELPWAENHLLKSLWQTGPRSVSVLDQGLLNLLNSQLVVSLGTGTRFGEVVITLNPALKDQISEYFARLKP